MGGLISEIRQYLSSIIVVDDGSADQTAVLATRAGAHVIQHPVRLGKGAALQTGCQKARMDGFNWVLTMDGDGQHSPADIPKFLARAQSGAAELIVGNRMLDAHAIPWIRRQVNLWMSRRLSKLTGLNLEDTQCGFRLFKLETWSTVELQSTHYETESELLLAFVAAGHSIEFVPIEVIYREHRSKIHPFRDGWRWFRWWQHAKSTTRKFE